MARNIGATLKLNNGNFFTGMKSAVSATGNLKSALGGATTSMKSQGKSADTLGVSMKSLAGKVVGVVAAYASFSGIKRFLSDAISLSNEQVNAEQRLQTTMSNVAGTTQAQISSIKAYAAELQGITTIGDEVSISGASQLATFQLQANTIKTLMPALSDLAVAQYGVSVSSNQMQSMANLVGKVMTGSTSALTRYGVTMNEAQSKILKTGTESQKAAMLVEVLGQNFGGLAEAMANTPKGRIQQLNNAWGDMKEVIGAQLYPALTNVLTYTTEKIPEIQGVLSGIMASAQPVINWVASTAIPKIGNAIEAAVTTGQEIYTACQPAFQNLGNVVMDVAHSIGNAFGGDSRAAIQSLANAAIPTLCNALTMAGNAISFVIDNWKVFAAIALPVITPIVAGIGLYKGAVAACNTYDNIRNGLVKANTILLGANKGSLKNLTLSQLAHNIASKDGIAQIKLQMSVMLAVGKAHLVNQVNCVKNTASIVAHKIATVAVSAATKAAAAAQWLLNSAFLASPVGWVVLGIGALVTTFVVLWRKCEGFRNFWTGLWDGIKSAAGKAWNSIKDAFGNIGSWFSDKWNAVKDGAGKAMDFIKQSYNEGALKPVVDKVAGVFGTVKTAIPEKFNGIKEAISEKMSAVANAVSGIKDKIAEKFNGVKDSIQTAFAPAIVVVSSIINGVSDVISTVVDGIKTHIHNTIIIVRKTILDIILGTKQNFQDFFVSTKTVFENIKNAVSGIFEGIKNVVSGVFQVIVGIFTLNMDTIRNGASVVMSGITGIIDGAKTVIINIWNAITSAATLAFNNVKTVVTNVIDGIKNVIKSIKDTFSNVFESIKGTVSGVFEKIKATISNAWDGIKKLIKTPHIEVVGQLSIAGLDTPIPKLGLKWYAQGGIMTRPTLFGMNRGNFLGGGEAGAEAVLPLDVLWKQLGQFADRIVNGGKEPAMAAAATNNIYVTVQGGGNDEDLPNKVAQRIVEVLNNL